MLTSFFFNKTGKAASLSLECQTATTTLFKHTDGIKLMEKRCKLGFIDKSSPSYKSFLTVSWAYSKT
jgi:hypothetical protein